MPKRKCKFDERIKEKYPEFVVYIRGRTEYEAECILCRSFVSVANKGSMELKNHLATEKHKKNIKVPSFTCNSFSDICMRPDMYEETENPMRNIKMLTNCDNFTEFSIKPEPQEDYIYATEGIVAEHIKSDSPYRHPFQNMISKKIGFIGAGNMAQAIGFALVSSDIIEGSGIIVSAPSMANLQRWESNGVHTTLDNNDVVKGADIIFLAIKPQYLDTAIHSLKKSNVDVRSKVFVSILVGVKIETLQKKLSERYGESPLQIVRVMPNTPILVGCGFSAICSDPCTSEENESLVKRIMEVGGLCESIPESLFNAFSGVCGSGPAYVFVMIEALADAAVKQGIARELALRMAAKTVEGAGRLVAVERCHPAQLKDQVCSPGGTTIAGIHSLEVAGFRGIVMNAVEASAKRANEMSSS